MLRRHVGGAADAVLGFDHPAIDAEIVRAGLGIARHPHAGGDERRRIETRRRHQMRKAIDPAFQVGGAPDDLLHRRIRAIDDTRLQVIAVRACPGVGDLVRLDGQRRAIDRARAAKRAQHDGTIEYPPTRIGDVAEPERLALRFLKPAKLQPHQRHQLGVLADLVVDDREQPAPRQLGDIVAQVPIGHGVSISASAGSSRESRRCRRTPGTAGPR
jgi:hypothetical protein